MRPLKLTVRGLRSFASETTIDLDRLGEAGLFAIHGPTGAGKSSLLDGIFLALFGKTPRGEPSECVSTGAFELAVRLELEVGRGEARREIAVERCWRWSKRRVAGGGVERGTSRHTPVRIEERERGGSWRPIDPAGVRAEEYLRDQVVRVGFKDFQQAVVLPQGEFDALLRATPTDRRSLVATLFRTERLGDPLYQAIRAREVDVEKEITGLAEVHREVLVTDEEVAAAGVARGATATRAAALQTALQAAESRAVELDQARRRVEAREAARRSLETTLGELAAREGDRARIDRARRATVASGPVSEVERREEQERAAAAKAAEAARRAAEAEARRAAAADACATATRARDEALPAIREQLARARLAAEREREIAPLAEACATSRGELLVRERVLAGATTAVEQARAALAAARAAERDALRRLEEVRVGEGERAEAMAALAQCEALEAESEARAAHERARAAATQRVEALAAALAAEEERVRAADAAVHERMVTLRAREIDAMRAHGEIERGERALADARRAAAAADLAERLRDGDPCPVCGAVEHPGADHLAAAWAIDACERAVEAARALARSAEREQDVAEHALDAEDAAALAAAARVEEALRALEASREAVTRLEAAAVMGVAAGDHLPGSVAAARDAARRAAARAELAFSAIAPERRDAVREASRRWLKGLPAGTNALGAAEAMVAELNRRARAAEELGELASTSRSQAEHLEPERAIAEEAMAEAERERAGAAARLLAATSQLEARRAEIAAMLEGMAPGPASPAEITARLEARSAELTALRDAAAALGEAEARSAERAALEARHAASRLEGAAAESLEARAAAEEAIACAGFADRAEVRAASMPVSELAAMIEALERLDRERRRREAVLEERSRDVDVEVSAEEAALAGQRRDEARREAKLAELASAEALAHAEQLARRSARAKELCERMAALEPRARRLAAIRQLVAGKQLAELAAERHLEAVTRAAATLLSSLSSGRYTLVRSADGGFAVADAAGGGVVRAPSTLSGGETFLVSLALALALSERIQLAGRTRFDFFFLDEGFGSLDPATLDTALTALERLRGPHRVIGIISHVAAIEERMPRKLRVTPARPGRAASVLHEP